ncbi:MAG: MarR family transcriptional regulator [Planctomycetota bacterium]
MGSSRASAPRNLQQEVGKVEPFDQPEQEAYLNLIRTTSVLADAFTSLFKSYGVSDAQYNALRIIASAGRVGIRSETVGERMVARDPDTTRLIDRLQKAGLVERDRLSDDRRCVVARVTAEGRRLLRRITPHVQELHQVQLGHLSRTQLRQFNALLFLARHPE